MSATPIPAFSAEVFDAFSDVLSTDQELRAIELAFLHRLLGAAIYVSAETLQKRGVSHKASVGATLEKMQSQPFEVIAQELAIALPPIEGFGRFCDSQNKDGPT